MFYIVSGNAMLYNLTRGLGGSGWRYYFSLRVGMTRFFKKIWIIFYLKKKKTNYLNVHFYKKKLKLIIYIIVDNFYITVLKYGFIVLHICLGFEYFGSGWFQVEVRLFKLSFGLAEVFFLILRRVQCDPTIRKTLIAIIKHIQNCKNM